MKDCCCDNRGLLTRGGTHGIHCHFPPPCPCRSTSTPLLNFRNRHRKSRLMTRTNSLIRISFLFFFVCTWPMLGSTQRAVTSAQYIRASNNSNSCFHKKNAGWDNGNPVHLWSCAEGQTGWKTWVYEPSTGYIRNAARRDKCLHKKENNWNNGNAIHLWDCNAGNRSFKTWTYDSSTGQIRARSNQSKCMHKKLNNWRNGNPIHLWDCNAGHARMKSWRIGNIAQPPVPPSQDHLVSWFKPSRLPADLEDWLNTRMRGFTLLGITRDDSSGRYYSFFRKRPSGSRPLNYKVMVVPEDNIEQILKRAPSQALALVAVTSFQAGPRGLQYVCFFRRNR